MEYDGIFHSKKREALVPISQISNDIYKKPYNSGATIYLTKDHKNVLLGHWWGVISINLITGQMKNFCSIKTVDLAGDNIEILATGSTFGEFEIIQSSLNEKLLYLGRFELVKYKKSGSGRYDDVAFKTATGSSERENDIAGKCG